MREITRNFYDGTDRVPRSRCRQPGERVTLTLCEEGARVREDRDVGCVKKNEIGASTYFE